jgi:hypothetical protein
METSKTTKQGEVRKPTVCRKTNAYSFRGITRPSTGTSSVEGRDDGAHYSEMLTDRLKSAIRSKCWGLPSKNVAAWKWPSIRCCPHSWNPLETQVWCNGLVPILPFLTVTCFVHKGPSTHLGPRNEAVHARLTAHPKTFFFWGIRKLVERLAKCVQKQGD